MEDRQFVSRITKRLSSRITLALVFLVVMLVFDCYLMYEFFSIKTEFKNIQTITAQSEIANREVLSILKQIQNTQEQAQIKLASFNKIKQQLLINKEKLQELKDTGFHTSSSLVMDNTKPVLSAEDMDRIINYYDSIVAGGTGFTNKGYVFIQASRETGLNPLYLFAHAAVESAYGTSYYARTRGNYYGINAVDSNPDNALHMGDSMEQGIMAGSRWIAANYTNQGYTTLDEMYSAGYATSPRWAHTIVSVMNTALSVI